MESNDNTTGYRWQLPHRSEDEAGHKLKILNSFTRKKEPFLSNQSKTIKWYSCGPTVYDVAHLGHARCYITFDIMRRIMANYFGYQVFYVMNITDIDDKIIKRARSNHLCDKFVEQILNNLGNSLEFLAKIESAIESYSARRVDEKDPFKIEMNNGILIKSREALKELKAIDVGLINSSELFKERLEQLRDVIADQQDHELGHTVNDHQIFRALTLKYEREYHEDMQRLDVLPPNALTRVSEFIDEVGLYLKKLESNGFAYRAAGSVYFDTSKFDADPKHSYAKLVREAFGQKKCLDEGEGELSVAQHDYKRSPTDFALWKKSKVGEPSWKTQDYEPGRPGWHIECSVMASHLLGENFDIHSGGCDLKFPHHDNEIAQAEAYYNTGKNWVNYFVHSGHLSISGCKMSKSLKNFITIRQALEEYSSRQLRFAFLAHSWAETLDYSPNTMNTAISYEKTFKEFFLNVSDTLRRRSRMANAISKSSAGGGGDICEYFQKWSNDDQELNKEFSSAINKVDIALCDNLDTRSALNVLTSLVKETNKRPQIDLILLKDIACFIERMLKIFGANFEDVCKLDKFLTADSSQMVANGARTSSNDNNIEAIFKYIEALAQFRADVRRFSKAGDAQKSVRDILALCDTLRDQTLPDLGIRLEDKEVDGSSYVVKMVDAETIAKEKALDEKKEMARRLKEETVKLEKLKLQQQRDDKMRIPPNEMFRNQTDKYSKFDDKGMPTHDTTGKEVSKSALKKLQRLYAEQEVRYSKFVTDQQASSK